MWLCCYQIFKYSNLQIFKISKVPSLENRKVGSIYHIFVSCFLIETKFVSKLWEKFRRQYECQEIPRLRLFMIFKNSSFLIINIQEFWVSEIQKWTAKVSENKKILKSQFHTLELLLIFFDSFILLAAHSRPYRFILGILFGSRLEPAMSHEPRAEQNAKNEAIRPWMSRK